MKPAALNGSLYTAAGADVQARECPELESARSAGCPLASAAGSVVEGEH